MTTLTINTNLRPYRSRALAAMRAVGTQAWDVGQWDAEMDAQAYCLDAVSSLPAGSSRWFVGMFGAAFPIPTRTER